MNPKDIRIEDFTYHLPEERIAKYPLAERDQSKLLEYKEGKIAEYSYAKLDSLLPIDSLLVFNNTKVVEARLIFTKSTGGKIELFCLEPDSQYQDITVAMLQQDRVVWNCLVGGAKKWKADEALQLCLSHGNKTITLEARMIDKLSDCFQIEFSWDRPHTSFAEVLHEFGIIPLPPYLNREAEKSDLASYQTVYAKHDGSVAAPTAGLHFTPALLQRLKEKSIDSLFVTLHVGAGTFKPVKSETLSGHDMHAEFIDVKEEDIKQLLKHHNGTIIPVGTTSFRTIESLYWMGVKASMNPEYTISQLEVKQWDVYELPQEVSVEMALQSLIHWMKKNNCNRLICKTQLLVTPYYKICLAKAILTNFHQPNSTLLLLISAFVGDAWKMIYDYALANDFRFLSYGDGSLLWRKD
jgi:S-adenosylmethionine:tRNA ribosyltransferase-isomerase